MLDYSKIFYDFTGIIIGFILAVTLIYFLTYFIFNALTKSLVLYLFGTTEGVLSVIQQLLFLLN